jgi:hypothetical protein
MMVFRWPLLTVVSWRQGDDPTEHINATRRCWSTLEPFTHGFYVNDLALEATSKDINENYRGNYRTPRQTRSRLPS